MRAAEHFTATIEVKRTTHTPPAVTSASYGRGEARPDPKREVVDVARVVIRAESLRRCATRSAVTSS